MSDRGLSPILLPLYPGELFLVELSLVEREVPRWRCCWAC